jgi:hypothetical protein
VGDDRLRGPDPELVAELLKGALVVDLRQGAKRRREEAGDLRDTLVLGRQVEDLLEHRDHDLDVVLAGEGLDVGDELLGVAGRRRRGEMTREVLGVAARRGLVGVAGVDLVAALAELPDRVERERHPGAGDQDLHRAYPSRLQGG